MARLTAVYAYYKSPYNSKNNTTGYYPRYIGCAIHRLALQRYYNTTYRCATDKASKPSGLYILAAISNWVLIKSVAL